MRAGVIILACAFAVLSAMAPPGPARAQDLPPILKAGPRGHGHGHDRR